MIFSEKQANEVYDIIVAHGNMSVEKSERYGDMKRSEFVHSATTGSGISEYWYQSDSYSSFKLYFQKFWSVEATFHAQTITESESGVPEAMSEALRVWSVNQ